VLERKGGRATVSPGEEVVRRLNFFTLKNALLFLYFSNVHHFILHPLY
jgi:hypothetical protein